MAKFSKEWFSNIYIIQLFLLAFLPGSILFVSPIARVFFYLLQILFFYFGLKISIANKNGVFLNYYWLLILFSVGFSLSGLLLGQNDINSSILLSYISFIFLIINSGLFFSNLQSLKLENFKSIFSWFIFICLIIGILQYFGIIDFEFARTKYFVAGEDNKILEASRSTSLFIEPSGWAYFYSLFLFYSIHKHSNKFLSIVIVFASLFLSNSGSGYVFVILLLGYWFIFSKSIPILIKLSVLSVFIFCIIYIGYSQFELIDKLFFRKDYRNVAPALTLSYLLNESPESLILGNGIFSLLKFTPQLDLAEYAQTTTNFYVDVLFELGLLGLFGALIFLYKSIRMSFIYFIILLVFISQFGYRSYLIPFTLFLFWVTQNTKLDKENNA